MIHKTVHRELYQAELDVIKLAALVMPGIVNLLQDIQQGDSIFVHEMLANSIAVKVAQRRIAQRCAMLASSQVLSARDSRHGAVIKRSSQELEQMSQSAVRIAIYITRLRYRGQHALFPTLDLLIQLLLEQLQAGTQIFIEQKMHRTQDLFATNEALEAQYWQVVQALREQSGQVFSAAVMTASIFLLLTNELDSVRERVAVICDQAIYLASGGVPTIA